VQSPQGSLSRGSTRGHSLVPMREFTTESFNRVSELTLLSDFTENRPSWPETSLYFQPFFFFVCVVIECLIWKLLNEVEKKKQEENVKKCP